MKRSFELTVFGMGLFAIIFFIFIKFYKEEDSSQVAETDITKNVATEQAPKEAPLEQKPKDNDKVLLFANQLISDNLKAPSTAQFISTEIIYHKETPTEERYIAKVKVDSQNEYSAMIRAQFCVAFTHTKGEDENIFHFNKHRHMETCEDNDERMSIGQKIGHMRMYNFDD